jgi:hypothetical protein
MFSIISNYKLKMINAFRTKNVALMNYMLTWIHKTHHGSNLGEVTIFLPIVYFVSPLRGH